MTTKFLLALLLALTVWTADSILAQPQAVVASPEETSGAAGTSRRAGQEIISAPGSPDILALNPFAFEPFDPTARDALLATGVARYCQIPGSDCFLHAPVELQSGSTITRLELDAVDSGAGAVRAWFYRCPAGTADCFAVESAFTIDTPGRTRVGTDFSVPEVIDNNAFYYGVVVGLYGGSAESRLEGVRLHFDPIPSRIRARFWR